MSAFRCSANADRAYLPTTAACLLNTGAIWTAIVGLPAGVAVLAIALVLSVAISDFCYIGPQAVLTAKNDDNQYVAYYLRCEGSNPLEMDVSALDDAVDALSKYADELEATGACDGVSDALDAIDESIEVLEDSIEAMTNDILTCENISPLVGDLFYDAVCDKTVQGLYDLWVARARAD